MKYRIETSGQVYELDVELQGDTCVVRQADGTLTRIRVEPSPDGGRRAMTPWGELELQSARPPGELWADVAGRRLYGRVERVRAATGHSSTADALGIVSAPMAGKLLRVAVQVGERVRAGQLLAVIEAMKMENALTSPIDGVVIEVTAGAPCALERGAPILKLEAS